MAALLAMLTGCNTLPLSSAEEGGDCRRLFARVDRLIEQRQGHDRGAERIKGFPYLRINRLLASFRHEVDEGDRFTAWSRQLAQLDAEARRYELRNLNGPVDGMDGPALQQRLDGCRQTLLASELSRPEMQQQLRKNAVVKDSYVTWWRYAGLYPLTAPFVSLGIARWHKETRQLFATPRDELVVSGKLQRWGVTPRSTLSSAQVAAIVNNSRDPLGIAHPDEDQRRQLFENFAPVWEVDVASDDDRPGTISWHDGPAVFLEQATLYRHLSHVRFNGEVLMQLNYIIWFPSRPGDDIYAGHLDGINWRVTLGPDGTPWLYDAIHNCGCYYQAFPSRHLRLRSDLPAFYSEQPLVPQAAPDALPVTVRIAARTHYLQRVYHQSDPVETMPMQEESYDTLRSLVTPHGYHSLFDDAGLIASSKRSERFLLWPMGIRSPGAMRQWGQHATAFVGRRHFDDAHLLDNLFEAVNEP